MDFSQQTALYISGAAPDSAQVLKTLGLPAGAPLESNYFDYRDTINYPLAALGTITQSATLLTKETGGGFVRNFKFPTTSDFGFLNYVTFCYADITFDPALTTSDPLFGPMLATAAEKFLKATKLTVQVASKEYLDSCVHPWANYETPSIVQPLQGALASAPFAVFPPTYHNHHRVYLQTSPPIIWPANVSVRMTVSTNVASYEEDLTGSAPNLALPPWNIALSAELGFVFVGNQVRVTK